MIEFKGTLETFQVQYPHFTSGKPEAPEAQGIESAGKGSAQGGWPAEGSLASSLHPRRWAEPRPGLVALPGN